MATTEPIRDKKDTKALANYFLKLGQFRNYCLVVLSLNTGLRISDILRLRWNDVYDEEKGTVRPQISLTEKKTGKGKIVAVNAAASRAIMTYAKSRSSKLTGFLIVNDRTQKAISRIQAYRIIRAAGEALLNSQLSCHSLRKTFGYHAWQQGIPVTVIMEIYNHSSYSVTRRYLGITQDDQNSAYMKLSL